MFCCHQQRHGPSSRTENTYCRSTFPFRDHHRILVMRATQNRKFPQGPSSPHLPNSSAPAIWYVQLPRIPACPQFLNSAMINLYTGDNYSKNVFIQALPKMYAIRMMWTLNARRAILVAFASGGSDGTSTEEAVPRNVERTRRVCHLMFEPTMISFQLFCAQDEIPFTNLNGHIKPAVVSVRFRSVLAPPS